MYTSMALIQWLLLGGIALTAFMVGRSWSKHETDLIIEQTIISLIQQRMVKAKKVNGEYEIYEYDQDI
jgi:hypothetical protein